MKAIYLNDNIDTVNRVYSHAAQAQLSERFGEMLKITSEQLTAHATELAGTEYIFSTWGMPALTGEQIDKYFPALKAVFYGAGSVQHFAKPFIERGITVCSSWQANGVPVAEHTMSLILLSNNGFFCRAGDYRADRSKSTPNDFPGNYGCKVGLVGFGTIGRRVASFMKPFNVKLMAYDPYVKDEAFEALGVSRASLEEIFSECQTISNHLPNNAQTKGMLGYELFERMKYNATFINTGRGAQVVEDDLIRAMRAEPRRTALLDVTFPEPCPASSELWSLPNVIITPHIAGSSGDEVMRMGEYMLAEYDRFAAGQPLKYAVSMAMLEHMA